MDNYIKAAIVASDSCADATARRRAFSDLMRQFHNMAYGCAVSFLGDPAQAEDAVQEAFITAWCHMDQLRSPAAFPAWLRRIVVWQCHYYKSLVRPSAVPVETLIDHFADGRDLATAVERDDLMHHVRKIMWTLPRHQREILILHYLDQYSHREIAGFLDLTEGAVRKRLHDARKKTRKLYEGWFKNAIGFSGKARSLTGGKVMKNVEANSSGRAPEDVIDGMIKPAWCVETEEGRLVWDLFGAAIRNDGAVLRRHLRDDPECARLEFWYTPPLHFAVRQGNLEATRILWEAHAHEEVTRLIGLADDRGHAEVAAYLREQIDAGATLSDLRLHEAVESDDAEMVDHLLRDDSALTQQCDPRGCTPLHLAVIHRRVEALNALLVAGADPDPVDHGGFRPIHYAYWRNAYWGGAEAPELARRLFEGGARDSITLAAARGDLDAVRQFLDGDANLANDGDTLEKRPLSAATERGHRDIVRCLLDRGADPTLRETRICPHGSALMAATVNDDLELAGWLLQAGADPNGGIDSSGWPASRAPSDAMRGLLYGFGGKSSPVWGYIQRGELETVAAILRYSADPFADDVSEYQSTPYTAIISGFARQADKGESTEAHQALMQLFLQRRYPMPAALTECKSYLYHVPALTRQLLEHGLDPNLPDWQRCTPLHDLAGRAPDGAQIELVEMFLDHGANIDAIDEEDRSTPLGLAARSGNVRLVELLLEKGADPNLASAAWATPLAWAEKRGHNEVVETLRRRSVSMNPGGVCAR